MNHIDSLKGLIYEDFLNSIASVRAGANPGVAFRDHEARVSRLRMEVARSEASYDSQACQLSLVA
jgi:hypothetical protein